MDLFRGAWQPVLIVDNRGVKRHVVGKKCISYRIAGIFAVKKIFSVVCNVENYTHENYTHEIFSTTKYRKSS